MFKLSISSLVLRYYLMMVVAILAVYTSQDWLVFLAFAIAVSAVLGYRVEMPSAKESGRLVRLEGTEREKKQKAS